MSLLSMSDPLIKERVEKAEQLEAHGDLARAKIQWEIAETLSPNDAAIRIRLRKINQKIEDRIKQHRKRGKSLSKRGSRTAAGQEYLNILRLDPNDTQALQRLREIKSNSREKRYAYRLKQNKSRFINRYAGQGPGKLSNTKGTRQDRVQALLVQSQQPGKERQTIDAMERYLKENPADTKIPDSLISLRLERVRELFNAGDYKQALANLTRVEQLSRIKGVHAPGTQALKKEFAEKLYNSGVRLFRRDMGQAVDLWKNALRFNPDHPKAKLRLGLTQK